MSEWNPTTLEELNKLVLDQLSVSSPDIRSIFERYRVVFYQSPIVRYGSHEYVYVVAQRGDEVIYYEDVERGFNISRIDVDKNILEHWCNQDDLGQALIRWR